MRYRARFPLAHLRAKYGIESSFVIPGYRPDRAFLFFKVFLSALFFQKPDSVIVIQRVRSNFLYANLLKLLVLNKPGNTIYDVDDADYLEYSSKTIFFFCKNCTTISAGSYALKDKFQSLNNRIFVNSTPVVDLNIIKENRSQTFTIGWVGFFGGDHRTALENYCFPALKELPFSFKLTFLGVRKKSEKNYLHQYFKSHNNIELEIPAKLNWQDEKDLQSRIKEFDIGIATLLDNELHRSKSAFKAKQYLNNGVPVLSSNFPENNRFIEDGINGYLCGSSKDFYLRILELYNMKGDKYSELSLRARKSIEKFNETVYCNNLVKGLPLNGT